MARARLILVLIVAFILLMQGLTQGRFLGMIIPGWEAFLGYFFCWAGGFIVQPVWDVGWAKIPLPTTDDWLAGVLLGTAITWLILKRVQWSFRKKVLVWLATVVIGMYLYKGLGLLFLYWAEVGYGMRGCLETIDIGFLQIQYSWFDPLFMLMILFVVGSAFTAILAFKKRQGGSSGK